jgi:hypothetical protein
MKPHKRWWIGFALAGSMAVVPRMAAAQAMPTGPTSPSTSTNPYLNNPYMNPFLNPALMGTNPQTNAQGMAMYMLSMNQAAGGIGSGRISGTRPEASAPATGATHDSRRVTDIPGARAARYFNRTAISAASPAPTRYYNRQERSLSSNRH